MSTDGSKLLVLAGEVLSLAENSVGELGLATRSTSGRETISWSYFSQGSKLGFCFVINQGLKEGHEVDLARHQLI